jgi:NADH-quinone oxidoreductase subunit F
VPVQGSQFVIPLDTLLVAVGEEPDAQSLGAGDAIEVSRAGAIVVGPETLATGVAGVFAGGDVVTGPNTVIDAMASGKLAAEMIDKYLRGEALQRDYGPTRPSAYLPAVELTEQEIEQAERPAAPCLDVRERQGSFKEVELTWTEAMAMQEARRCLRCDLETEDAKRSLAGSRPEGGCGCG